MSVTSEQIERGVEVLRSHGATKVILFGSAATDPEHAHDVDLACEGIPPESFFKAAAELEDAINSPIDLIDLSQRSAFVDRVRSRGRVLFETIEIRQEVAISMAYASKMVDRLSGCLEGRRSSDPAQDVVVASYYLSGIHRAIVNAAERFVKWARPGSDRRAGSLQFHVVAPLLGERSGLFSPEFVAWFGSVGAVRDLHELDLRTAEEMARIESLSVQAKAMLGEFRDAIDSWVVHPEPVGRVIDEFLAHLNPVPWQFAGPGG